MQAAVSAGDHQGAVVQVVDSTPHRVRTVGGDDVHADPGPGPKRVERGREALLVVRPRVVVAHHEVTGRVRHDGPLPRAGDGHVPGAVAVPCCYRSVNSRFGGRSPRRRAFPAR